MHYSRKAMTRFPFHGTFYSVPTETPDDGDLIGDGNDVADDGDLLGDDDEEVETELVSETDETEETTETDTETTDDDSGEVILLETECDIQEANKLFSSGVLITDYDVYFDKEKVGRTLPFGMNCKFRCDNYPITLQGFVREIVYSPPFGYKIGIRVNSY